MQRKSVGVRLPSNKVCQAILEGLEHPLLCTSVHVPETLSPDTETPDLGSMLTAYSGKRLVVQCAISGLYVLSIAQNTLGLHGAL